MARRKIQQESKNILGCDESQELLNPHMPELITATSTGLENYKLFKPEQLEPLGRGTKKRILNDYIVDAAVAMLDGVPGVVMDDQSGGTLLIFDGRLALRYKYVEGRFHTSNATTDRQKDIYCQQLQIEGMATLTLVTFGYTLNAVWQEFIRTRIFCRENGNTLWHIPVFETEVTKTLAIDTGTAAYEAGPSVSSKQSGRKEG